MAIHDKVSNKCAYLGKIIPENGVQSNRNDRGIIKLPDKVLELIGGSTAEHDPLQTHKHEYEVRDDFNIFNIYTGVLKELKLDLKSLLPGSFIDRGKENKILDLINMCFEGEVISNGNSIINKSSTNSDQNRIFAYSQTLAKECIKTIDKVIYRQTEVVMSKADNECTRRKMKELLLNIIRGIEQELLNSTRIMKNIYADLQHPTFKFIYCLLKHFIEEIAARLKISMRENSNVNEDHFPANISKRILFATRQTTTRNVNLDKYSNRLDKMLQKWTGKSNLRRTSDNSDVVLDCYHCMTKCEKLESYNHVRQPGCTLEREHRSCLFHRNLNQLSSGHKEALKVDEVSNAKFRSTGRSSVSSCAASNRDEREYHRIENRSQHLRRSGCHKVSGTMPPLKACQLTGHRQRGTGDLLPKSSEQPVLMRCEHQLVTKKGEMQTFYGNSIGNGNLGLNHNRETCCYQSGTAGEKNEDYKYLVLCESASDRGDSSYKHTKTLRKSYYLDCSVQPIYQSEADSVMNASQKTDMAEMKNENLKPKTKRIGKQKDQKNKEGNTSTKKVFSDDRKNSNTDNSPTEDDGKISTKKHEFSSSHHQQQRGENYPNYERINSPAKLDGSATNGNKTSSKVPTEHQPKDRKVSKESVGKVIFDNGEHTLSKKSLERENKQTSGSNSPNQNNYGHCTCCKCNESKGNDITSPFYISSCHCDQSNGEHSDYHSNRPIYQFFANPVVPIPCKCPKSKDSKKIRASQPTPTASRTSNKNRESQDVETQTSKKQLNAHPSKISSFVSSKDEQNSDPFLEESALCSCSQSRDRRESLDMETQTCRPGNKDAFTTDSKCYCPEDIEDVFQEFDDNYSKVVREIKLLIREGYIPRCQSVTEPIAVTREFNITSRDSRKSNFRKGQPSASVENNETDKDLPNKTTHFDKQAKSQNGYPTPDLRRDIEELKGLVRNTRMGSCPCCKCCQCRDGSKPQDSKLKRQPSPQIYNLGDSSKLSLSQETPEKQLKDIFPPKQFKRSDASPASQEKPSSKQSENTKVEEPSLKIVDNKLYSAPSKRSKVLATSQQQPESNPKQAEPTEKLPILEPSTQQYKRSMKSPSPREPSSKLPDPTKIEKPTTKPLQDDVDTSRFHKLNGSKNDENPKSHANNGFNYETSNVKTADSKQRALEKNSDMNLNDGSLTEVEIEVIPSASLSNLKVPMIREIIEVERVRENTFDSAVLEQKVSPSTGYTPKESEDGHSKESEDTTVDGVKQGSLEIGGIDSDNASVYNEPEVNKRPDFSSSKREIGEQLRTQQSVVEDKGHLGVSYAKQTAGGKKVRITALHDDNTKAISPERRALYESRENLFRDVDLDKERVGGEDWGEAIKMYKNDGDRSVVEDTDESMGKHFSFNEKELNKKQDPNEKGPVIRTCESSTSKTRYNEDTEMGHCGDDDTIASNFSSCDLDLPCSSIHSSSSSTVDECRKLLDSIPCYLYSDDSCMSSVNEVIKATETELYVMIIESQPPVNNATDNHDEIISLLLAENNNKPVDRKIKSHKNYKGASLNDGKLTSKVVESGKAEQPFNTSWKSQKIIQNPHFSRSIQTSYESILDGSDSEIKPFRCEKPHRQCEGIVSKRSVALTSRSLKFKRKGTWKENRRNNKDSNQRIIMEPRNSEGSKNKEVQVTKWNAKVQTAGPKKFNRTDISREVEDKWAAYLGLERTKDTAESIPFYQSEQLQTAPSSPSKLHKKSIKSKRKD